MILFITGGHLTPALATIDELLSRKLHPEIVFIGRTVAMEGTTGAAYEKAEMQARGIRFLPVTTGRLQRFASVHAVLSLIKIPVGIVQSLYYCIREKPDAILSFGGYIALPVAIAGLIRRIPIITHEQTTYPGLSNRIIAAIAKKICISFKETASAFPGRTVIYTGLPLRKEFFTSDVPNSLIPSGNSVPVLYVTGGSTGSVSVNALIFPIIDRLTQIGTVIHQTGKISYRKAQEVRERLPANRKERYIVLEYLDSTSAAAAIRSSALVIGRSGANTVMELALFGKISVLIPLPWSAGGEQLKNAQWLESSGTAKISLQHELTPELLYETITGMLNNGAQYRRKARTLSEQIPHDAAARVADELLSLI